MSLHKLLVSISLIGLLGISCHQDSQVKNKTELLQEYSDTIKLRDGRTLVYENRDLTVFHPDARTAFYTLNSSTQRYELVSAQHSNGNSANVQRYYPLVRKNYNSHQN